MAEKFKKSIYLTGKLIDIYDECRKKERNRSFSGRIADIAERYNVLIEMTDVPFELTSEEKIILGEAVLGGFMDKTKIRYLHESIRDTELEGNISLAEKVEELDVVQRMALIESLGI